MAISSLRLTGTADIQGSSTPTITPHSSFQSVRTNEYVSLLGMKFMVSIEIVSTRVEYSVALCRSFQEDRDPESIQSQLNSRVDVEYFGVVYWPWNLGTDYVADRSVCLSPARVRREEVHRKEA